MTKGTQALKTSMTVLRGGNVPSYTLEYLSPSKKKGIGEFETIVVPYIEMGRANKCNVQFGDDFPTVSRVHAAIERRNNKYFLIHLSHTNPTLINGQPIAKEGELANGDEIQLSMEGPKMRFNTTASGTANMGFTRKIGLVTKQAIKPYKTMVFILLAFIIILGGTGAWFLYKSKDDLRILQGQLEADRKAYMENIAKADETIAQIQNQNSKVHQEYLDVVNELDSVKKIIDDPGLNNKDAYVKYKNNVYFLQVVEIFISLPDGQGYYLNNGWIGTGFLCEDGKFVTARHCIQGWRFSSDETSNLVNYAELNGGTVNVKFRATSENDWFEFDYSQVILDDSEDEIFKQSVVENGSQEEFILKYAQIGGSDWAYIETGKSSNIEYDKDLSLNLNAGEELVILGFSLGIGGPTEGSVEPLYSESTVAQGNLKKGGIILVTDRNFESGNSGGPVFVRSGNTFKCIGIISFSRTDAYGGQSTIGGIVPIAYIK